MVAAYKLYHGTSGTRNLIRSMARLWHHTLNFEKRNNLVLYNNTDDNDINNTKPIY